jgi:8-oxo-dGTP pyrophosphatase MutT (NUDIX family)
MERPAPRARLRRDGPPAVPRESASLILVRDGAAGLELLLVRRNPAQRFAGGCWVFPGGALDAAETHRAAAVRELAEEAGVGAVEHEALLEYARWITPELLEIRFDTRFFVARAPAGARPRPDGEEAVDARWTTPRAALDAYAAGELELMFPTLKLLEGLAAFRSVAQLLDHARGLEVSPILPRIVLDGDAARIVLPGEPGYTT